MKYSKPEIEIVDIDMVDVIATSGDESEYTPGDNQTPVVPRNSSEISTAGYWGNNN